MSHRGSFRSCWRKVLESLWQKEPVDVAMVHDAAKEVYRVDHWSTIKNDLAMDHDGEIRLVMHVKRSEATELLEGLNRELFGKVDDGR